MFDPHFNAFCIEVEVSKHALLFITVSSFAHFQSFSVWTELTSINLTLVFDTLFFESKYVWYISKVIGYDIVFIL